jgi:hypothetical protein
MPDFVVVVNIVVLSCIAGVLTPISVPMHCFRFVGSWTRMQQVVQRSTQKSQRLQMVTTMLLAIERWPVMLMISLICSLTRDSLDLLCSSIFCCHSWALILLRRQKWWVPDIGISASYSTFIQKLIPFCPTYLWESGLFYGTYIPRASNRSDPPKIPPKKTKIVFLMPGRALG